MKRAFDVALAAFGLALSAVVWVVIAALIKLEDGGPVFFTQPRVGRGGETFTAYKFRSMKAHAGEAAARPAGEGDPRVTKIGRVLRATAMDELPQLWNILRGDMSFVGPRALAPMEMAAGDTGRIVRLADIPGYLERHRVRPGLTGLTQIYADRDIPHARKFRLDLLYVRNASFCLDLRLVLLSFWITFRGRWERRGRKV
jgi:lipopolysaccharide/colanic/teichoic acid biosynthesis glycosyltransferase